MKTLKFLFAGALAVAVLFACSDEEKIEPEPDPEPEPTPVVPEEPTEEDYAEAATISSDDTYFAFSEEEGYTVSFKTEGGQVVVDVDCGTDWDVENSASDVFTAECDYDNATLTISAEQNTVEEELTGTITLMTLPSKIEFASITVTQNAYGAVEIKVESNEWHVAAVGDNLSTTVSVEASDEWEVENTADWLTVEKGDAAVTITAKENEETEERTADITLTCTDGISTDSEIIRVTQDGHAYITVSDEELSVSADAGESTITVESNYEWESSCEVDWVTLTKSADGTALTIAYTANETEEEREATITLTAGDGEANTADAEISISQAFVDRSALVLEYTISSGNTKICLPLIATVNVTVDWGDGSSLETVSKTISTAGNAPSHTYSDAGVYEVSISGTTSGIKAATGTSASNLMSGADCLTAVKQWGKIEPTSMDYAFYNCTNLKSLPEGSAPFEKVTSFKYAFNANAFTELPSGMFDGCSSITDFSYAFKDCTGLTTVPDYLFNGCSGVTTFASTFSGCTGLTSLPENMFTGCTSATIIQYTFTGCTGLTKASIPANLFAPLTGATSFTYIFQNCTGLTGLPDGLFDGNTAVTTFDHAFSGCSNLEEVPGTLFAKNTAVTTFSYLFHDCESLKDVPEGLFDNNTSATDFKYVFYGCTSLTDAAFEKGGLFDKTAVTTLQDAFYRCTGLTKVPVNQFENCTGVTSFNSTFRYCTGLTSIPEGCFDNNPAVTDFAYVFADCTNITGEIPSGLFDKGTEVTSYNYAFSNCPGITKIPDGLFDYSTVVKTFNYAFSGCTGLTTVPGGLFAKCSSNVTGYQYVFQDCTGLTGKLPVIFGESPKATTCSGMFSGCSSITELEEGFLDNCTAATSFQAAFSGCSSLVTIPTSLFDYCTAVTNFKQTFYNCMNLEGESPYTEVEGVKIHLYERTSSNGFKNITAANYADCFTGCTKLTDYADILAAGWATE